MSDKWKKKDKNVQNCEVKEEVNSQEILEEDEKCDRGGESHAEEKVDESPAVEEERCCRCCCCDSDDDDDDDDDWDDDDWDDDDDDDDGECPYCGRAWKSTCLHHHDHYYHGRCCGDCDCDCDCDCECGCRGHYTKTRAAIWPWQWARRSLCRRLPRRRRCSSPPFCVASFADASD